MKSYLLYYLPFGPGCEMGLAAFSWLKGSFFKPRTDKHHSVLQVRARLMWLTVGNCDVELSSPWVTTRDSCSPPWSSSSRRSRRAPPPKRTRRSKSTWCATRENHTDFFEIHAFTRFYIYDDT